ncbi:MAG: hypothetical protein ACI8TE_001742 [Francisella sp.]|jgi:hypothetical protein
MLIIFILGKIPKITLINMVLEQDGMLFGSWLGLINSRSTHLNERQNYLSLNYTLYL